VRAANRIYFVAGTPQAADYADTREAGAEHQDREPSRAHLGIRVAAGNLSTLIQYQRTTPGVPDSRLPGVLSLARAHTHRLKYNINPLRHRYSGTGVGSRRFQTAN